VFELYVRVKGEDNFNRIFNPVFDLYVELDVDHDSEMFEDEFVSHEQFEHFLHLQELVFGNHENAIEECIKAVSTMPSSAIYSLLVTAYHQNDQFEKADELVRKCYELYPGHIHAKINYGFLLLQEKKFEQLEKLTCGFDIAQMAPERQKFHISEVTGILQMACLYFADSNQLLKASAYELVFDSFPDIPDDLFQHKVYVFNKICQLQLQEINNTK
jgi:Tfp pilus assembly protein PilF